MNKISVLSLLLIFSAGCSHSQVQASHPKVPDGYVNPEAVRLNHHAVDLYFNDFFNGGEQTQSLKKGLDSLNRAITLDSNYTGAYVNKLAFQMALDQPDSAFTTAELVVKKWPDDWSVQVTLGKLYDLKSDSASANKCYKIALSAINEQLKSTPEGGTSDIFFNIEKAKALILLNDIPRAQAALKNALRFENDETIKRSLNRLMTTTKQELLLQKPAPMPI